MKVPIYQVDAFATEPFTGNMAGVCILNEPKSSKWMQHVAEEMNVSETAFLLKQENGYNLRWFTPTVEVDLCGHATLASAHVLKETGLLKKDETVKFHTLSGILTAKLDGDYIELNFPSDPAENIEIPEMLKEALGTDICRAGKSRLGYIAEVESEEIVRKLKPDFKLLAKLPLDGTIVTSLSSSKNYDFVSRFFAPSIGLDEDPVTGSAHCCLGPYWKEKLQKNEFVAFQASRRGGILKLKVAGGRVYIKGNAVTVIKGELIA
ncbi:MAG: PhzF family phenazine biosynthesis protein [Bacillota bacterium]|nr:PhzF family phenazine biosynthesis protein [Bacillota bacterium]